MTTMPKKEDVLKSVDSVTDGVLDRAAMAADSVRDDVVQRAGAAMDAARQGAADLQDSVARGAGKVADGASKVADTVSAKLKSAGVDTDAMVDAAKGQATELQRLVADELKAHPFRALGVAAAFGLVVGLLSAR